MSFREHHMKCAPVLTQVGYLGKPYPLDLRNTFDSIWIDGLIHRLYEIEIDAKLWRLIRELYSDAQCYVQTGSEVSNWFTIGQGVHQGAPMSILLFQIFFNPLIN